jgi:2C-methyl-D-erythritol 2,4-cyclodiphosphate synthase
LKVNMRAGNGIDVHALVIGRSLAPGGVAIPFSHGIAALATVPLVKDR